MIAQSAPIRAAAPDAVMLGLGLWLWVALVLVPGVGLGLGLGLTLMTGPALPVGLAGMGGDFPQAVAANAMLAAIAAHRTCVLRTECSRMWNAFASNRQAQAQ
jgi:hypothetical protein